jgi:hypothetical protein
MISSPSSTSRVRCCAAIFHVQFANANDDTFVDSLFWLPAETLCLRLIPADLTAQTALVVDDERKGREEGGKTHIT